MRRSRYSYVDYVCALLGVCLTFAISVRISAGRLMWEDEVLGWTMLRDPSWRHMFHSWYHGTDGGGGLFYISGRIWFLLFGDSSTSFRSYSALWFSIAFVLLWFLARRFYSIPAIGFGFLVGWFVSPTLASHIGEGRFYGLFVAATVASALLVLHYLRQPKSTLAAQVATFLVFSALVTSHILGICYACMLLLGWFTADALQGRRNWRLYLAGLASGIWLLPSLPAIQAAAAVARPHFWTTQPTLRDIPLDYLGGSLRTCLIAAVLLPALLVSMLGSERRAILWNGVRQRHPILILMVALYLIPIILFVEGFVAAPLFNPRYMQPMAMATVLFFAELLTELEAVWLRSWRSRRLLVGVFCAATLVMVADYDLRYLPRHSVQQQPDYSAALTRSLPPRIPIVCEDAFTFIELMPVEAKSQVRYMFLLDWPNAIDARAAHLEVTQFHLMENSRNAGYYSDHIAYRDEFLARYPYFLVMETSQGDVGTLVHAAAVSNRDKMIGNPLASRFAADPQYQELPFAQLAFGRLRERVSLVCRKGIDCAELAARLHASIASPSQQQPGSELSPR